MLKSRYRLARNHHLIPKTMSKLPNKAITTHALLNKGGQKQYELYLHPKDPNRFVMFNQSEYIERKCSQIVVDDGQNDIVEKIGKMYPEEGDEDSLSIFIANDPQQANRLIAGEQKSQSLLSLAYRHFDSIKGLNSTIMLSIMGIQTQNSLTDQLSFEWLQYNKSILNSNQPIRDIIDSKTKINLVKQFNNPHYSLQNVSRHKIDSVSLLSQILKRYGQVKRYMEGWMQLQNTNQCYLLGQLYHLCETECNQEGQVIRIIRSHYLLRINQYIRSTAPLLLRMGMNLKKIHEGRQKCLNIQDSKLFKIISECFGADSKYHYHLFLQVGQYVTLKEEYLCLVPTSDFLGIGGLSVRQTLGEPDFLYSKNYIQNARVMSIIADIESNLSQPQKERIKSVIKQYEDRIFPCKFRLNTRSYHFKTINSEQRKVSRQHLMTESNEVYPKLELQDLVEQTCKIYRLPRANKSKEEKNNGSQLTDGVDIRKNKKTVLPSLKVWLSKESSTLKTNKSTLPQKKTKEQLDFLKQRGNVSEGKKNHNNYISEPSSQSYSAIRQWLNQVYGKRDRKVKQYYNNIHRRQQNKTQARTKHNSDNKGQKRDRVIPKQIKIKENKQEKPTLQELMEPSQ